MPKKKFDSRLHDLFSSFDHEETRPDAGQELEALLSHAAESPPEISKSEPPAPPAEPAAETAASPTSSRSGPPIIYEPDQVGYQYSESGLEPAKDSALENLDLSRAILAPLTGAGQSVGAMVIESDPDRPFSSEEKSVAEAIAQQVSLQIQNLRLLASAERARAEAQAATRQFTHESWESYLDAIHQNERIGYAYDLVRVRPHIDPALEDITHQVSVNVLDEQVGRILLKTEQNQPLTDDEQAFVSAVANQIGQQVENLRLLADAARARADAEEATRRLTRESWAEFAGRRGDSSLGYVYDQNQVTPISDNIPTIDVSQPLTVRGEPIGALAVSGLERVSTDSVQLMTEIANQASIHLETLRLNEELRERAAELQELDRLKSSFLANMSHELRTPLNSILGFSDVMLEGIDGPLTEYMQNDLRLIQKNGQHLLHLINDVLDMAKIESGRMNLHFEKFKISDVFSEVINITSTFANDKNLKLFIEPESNSDIEIFADVTRLRQVMINVVNNAIKFTEKGSVSIRADALEGSHILIAVKDTGIGIPPDHLETIFQEFSQVDTSTTRKAGGTGLGLPISRRLVELHGGRMWAESKNIPGEGSTLFVVLPLVAVVTESVEKVTK